ncbi:hypothetical protein QVD17_03565 [Tagetes erecta]|uniref:TF-B3 domain-containing protein n=1 Tax=Tagetes erecta TaxID=13708 RepID=A0AAD8LA71_TARER|nr:hypothetical protein QVD17_03565 [Tagetes erecta]
MATGSSSEPQQHPPSFFKVIRYPSDPHLALPKAFVRRHLSEISRNPKLVTETGGHSWRLEVVKIGEDYCFANGWEKLAKDVELCIRDIIIFWLIDSLTFQVLFLSDNGCEKVLPINKQINDDDDAKDIGNDGDDDDDDAMLERDLCFEKVISRKTYKYCMSLPMRFVRAAGLERKQGITLKDHEGREWGMGIIAERYARTKYSLTRGWLKFRRYHRLSDGDVCKFTFDKKEGVIKLTQLIKTKRQVKQEPSVEEVNRSCHGGENVEIKKNDWFSSVKVKVECESDAEMEIVNRKRGRSPLISCGNVNDGSSPEKLSRSDGVGVNNELLVERAVRSKHVVYF